MSKEAMKLALEALEETRNALAWFYDSYPQDVTKKGNELLPHVETVLTTLRGALTEQPAQQEPVAWIRWEWNRSGLRTLTFSKPNELPLAEEATGVVYDPLYAAPQPAHQEPIYQYKLANGSWIDQTKESHDYNVRHGQATVRVVYTSPPAQRKPLTDDEILAIGKELGLKCRLGGNSNIDFDYARAIEAAHGIKGER